MKESLSKKKFNEGILIEIELAWIISIRMLVLRKIIG
jgi:hypothetical protein